MSLRLIKCLLVVGSMLLFSIEPALAQTPSPEATSVARSLVTTLKLTEQHKALLPAILLSIKPALVQDRPEIKIDFEALKPRMVEAYTPYYNAMVDGITAVYASIFSVDDLREHFLRNGLLSRSRACRSARTAVARPPRTCGQA